MVLFFFFPLFSPLSNCQPGQQGVLTFHCDYAYYAPTITAFHFPLDILEAVFLNLPAQLVVCVCRLVCHYWKDVADSESFWRERCRREGYELHANSEVQSKWMWFYFLCKRRRNLIKNPRGEDGLLGWTIEENGGDGWRVESPMAPHPNTEVQTL